MQTRELTIISGKGGTGKTSVVASFAALAQGAILADCDVDAPNLSLVLKPTVERDEQFIGGKLAYIDPNTCIACGRCEPICRFKAIGRNGPGNRRMAFTFAVDRFACEGCTVCAEFCTEGAIMLVPAVNGDWFISTMRHGPMVHARLGAGQENSGKLVSLIRKEARRLAAEKQLGLIICDGPPGIGCPTIASLTGATLALLVVEPTVSGLHDFERVAGLAKHFKVPAMVCVNKHDINEEMTKKIEASAERLGVMSVGRIPYDEAVVKAQLAETSMVEYSREGAGAAIVDVWARVKERLDACGD